MRKPKHIQFKCGKCNYIGQDTEFSSIRDMKLNPYIIILYTITCPKCGQMQTASKYIEGLKTDENSKANS